jgi:hypothetical protein
MNRKGEKGEEVRRKQGKPQGIGVYFLGRQNFLKII